MELSKNVVEYDTLDWSFLKKLLVDMRFPAKCIHWIMTCVTAVSYSLLINGGLKPPFKAKKGLRQGDPISPYLFVLAMEYLGRKLSMLAQNGDFNYHPRCRKLGSVHICFADDLLIYCRTYTISIQLLHVAFMRFSMAYGLHANPQRVLYILLECHDTLKKRS